MTNEKKIYEVIYTINNRDHIELNNDDNIFIRDLKIISENKKKYVVLDTNEDEDENETIDIYKNFNEDAYSLNSYMFPVRTLDEFSVLIYGDDIEKTKEKAKLWMIDAINKEILKLNKYKEKLNKSNSDVAINNMEEKK